MGTEDQIQDAIGEGFLVADFLRNEGAVVFDSFLRRYENFIESVGTFQGPRAASALSGMSAVRGAYNNAVNSTPSWLAPLLREYAYVLDFSDTDVTRIMQSLYADFVENGKRIKSRQFTYGTVTAVGSPAGNGVIYRLTKDENGFDIENTYAQTVTFECVNDQNSGGVKFKENFRFRGGAATTDNIIIEGSDSDQTYPGISSDDSASYFQNCSFSSMNGTGTTKFDFWTISAGAHANFTQDTTNYFQVTPGDPVAASLSIAGNGTIEQAFSLNNTQFAAGTPFILRVPYNGEIGTLNAGAQIWLRAGEQVKIVTYASEAGWNFVVMELSDRAWYKKFAKNGGTISVEIHGYVSGSVKIDNIIVAPMIPFDGLWYAPCAGSTPFKVGDNYYCTDTAIEDAILQRFFVQHTGIMLPHSANASAITWADPVTHT